ncbi:MAG: DNA polymerase IV [Clostridia bacterium]|nr:DNA polymerase IV [Clostridia bacterium]
MKRTIIHVDMDAFFAAVEVRDNPNLLGKPLIIGALPHERGVVSTCSYEARRYGVHSAMNIKEAYRRCPHGIYMHGNMSKYAEASAQIHEIMLKYTDIIEFVALDEGYMDVTSSLRIFGSAENIGKQLKKEIYDAVGVTCSVGISYSMMGAKLASEEKKPDGFFVIPNREALVDLIRERPVGVISGIGSKTAERLKRVGIVTVQDLLNTPEENLKPFGAVGAEIKRLAEGRDSRQVVAQAVSKSIGREHTFQKDITDTKVLKDVLLLLSRDVSIRAKRSGMQGKTVTLKLKFNDMHSITRAKSGEATNSSKEIFKRVSELLDGLALTDAVRLVGVTVSNLQCEDDEPQAQLSLFDILEPEKGSSKQKAKALEDTIFDLHTKYGRSILKTAREMEVWNKINDIEND